MNKISRRDLTPLEYMALGLISMKPQSGYDIVNYFDEGNYSWSASPGSVYPMLKRLEQQDIITGTLEIEHETRPRKMYTLTDLGEKLLDEWLHEVPKMRPFYAERELAMLRFQFMEHRFTIKQTLTWIKNYLDILSLSDSHREHVHTMVRQALDESGQASPYKMLLLESIMIEQNALRSWLEMARGRLQALAIQTGEFTALSDIE